MADLTTKEGVHDWFSDRFVTPNSVVRLNGGLMNFVWRVEFKAQSCIVKHAPPYIATDPSIAVDLSRIDFEVAALQLFETQLAEMSDEDIRPPAFFDYEKEEAAFLMEDLHDFQPIQDSLPAFLGTKLGTFFGHLHTQTKQNDELSKKFNNLSIQQTRFEIQYDQVEEWLKPYTDQATHLGKIARDFGWRLLQPGQCLIMGDAWLPSFLVADDERIRVIDWEFSHYGRASQDLGHIAAHLWLAEATKMTGASSQVWKDFCDAYKKIAEWDDELEREISIHAAAEILSRTVGPFSFGFHDWSEAQIKENVLFAIALLAGENPF